MRVSQEFLSFCIYKNEEHIIPFEITRHSSHFLLEYSIQEAKSEDSVGSPPVKIIPSYFFLIKSSINSIHLL